MIGQIVAATLAAFVFPTTTGAPSVVAWDAFTGTNGASVAAKWSVWPSGATWTVSSNRARSTYADVTGMSIDPGVDDLTAVVTIARNGATVWDAGLSVAGNADASQFLTCEWNNYLNGSVELWLSDDGGWQQLGAATGLYPGGVATAPSSIVLRCTVNATTLSASVNGTTVVSVVLDETARTRHRNATHRWCGLVQYAASSATFDDVHVDVP